MRAVVEIIGEPRIPALVGWWLSGYRFLWMVLAVSAGALMAASLFSTQAHSAVLALRGVKCIVVITMCTILLKRRANDPVAGLLCLAFLSWTITSSVDFASASVLPLLLDRVRFVLFALALLLFPDAQFRPAGTRSVAVASGAVCLLGIMETAGLVPTKLFLPLAIGCVIAALFLARWRLRTAESEAVRQQLKWVALGLVGGIGLILCARAGAALTDISPVLQSMPILWEAMFQLGIVVIALGFLISLLRYRLFDAESAISRSAALAVLTASLVATFAGTEATIEWIGQQYFGMGIGNISATMAAAVAAVLLSPLHGRISDWAERHFQRDLLELRRDVPELLNHLAGTASPQLLGSAVLQRINIAIHATHSALLLRDKVIAGAGIGTKQARHSRESFPVRLELGCPACGADGWLLLGPRPDGSLYGADDLEAVKSILPALRHSLEASAASEAVRKQIRRIRRDLDSYIARSTANSDAAWRELMSALSESGPKQVKLPS
jgi:hypothetical protein